MFKTEAEARQNLSKTMSELNQLLKSMEGMDKAQDPGEAEGAEGADGGAEPDGLDQGGDMGAEGAAPAAPQGEPDGDEGGMGAGEGAAPGAEGDMGDQGQGGDMEAAARSQAAQLDDQELQMMAQVLQEELAKRQQAQADQGAGPEGAGDPNQLAMSMKSELASMAKSFTAEIQKLAKSVNDLKTENTNLKKGKTLPTQKPAATAASRTILEKSQKGPTPLNKSESIDYLMGKMRSKDRGGVNSGHVALVNACRSDDDLREAHGILDQEGIKIPTK